MLLPFVKDLISRADSYTRSQKYYGAILPVTIKGLISFAIYILFQVKLIICFQLCKLNNENNEIATPSNSPCARELEGVV